MYQRLRTPELDESHRCTVIMKYFIPNKGAVCHPHSSIATELSINMRLVKKNAKQKHTSENWQRW